MSRRRGTPDLGTCHDLPGDLRLEVNHALIGLGLNPANFTSAKLSDVIDALVGAAYPLGERLTATPGLGVV
jgi:hypothetical protein